MDGVISATYVWPVKTGRRDNPTYKHVIALARSFGVSPTYFFDEADRARHDPADVTPALQDAPGSPRLDDQRVVLVLDVELVVDMQRPSGGGGLDPGPRVAASFLVALPVRAGPAALPGAGCR